MEHTGTFKARVHFLKKDAVDRVLADCFVLCTFPRKIMFPLFEPLLTAFDRRSVHPGIPLNEVCIAGHNPGTALQCS